MNKTIILCMSVLFTSVLVYAGSPRPSEIVVLLGISESVNSETISNAIPWFEQGEEYSVKLNGQLLKEAPLVKVIKGEWSYTLYRFTYKVTKVLEGSFKEKELSFLIERKFPAPGSDIRLKELWPFHKNKVLIFKLRRGETKSVIVSIEQ